MGDDEVPPPPLPPEFWPDDMLPPPPEDFIPPPPLDTLDPPPPPPQDGGIRSDSVWNDSWAPPPPPDTEADADTETHAIPPPPAPTDTIDDDLPPPPSSKPGILEYAKKLPSRSYFVVENKSLAEGQVQAAFEKGALTPNMKILLVISSLNLEKWVRLNAHVKYFYPNPLEEPFSPGSAPFHDDPTLMYFRDRRDVSKVFGPFDLNDLKNWIAEDLVDFSTMETKAANSEVWCKFNPAEL